MRSEVKNLTGSTKPTLPVESPTLLTEKALAAYFNEGLTRLRSHGWYRRQRGGDGFGLWDDPKRKLRLIHSCCWEEDGNLWEHVSFSQSEGVMPGWELTQTLFHEVAGDEALGIIVIAPKSQHVNIAEVSHVWRCMTAKPLPDFTHGGLTI